MSRSDWVSNKDPYVANWQSVAKFTYIYMGPSFKQNGRLTISH